MGQKFGRRALIETIIDQLKNIAQFDRPAAGSHCPCPDRWHGVFRVAVSGSDGAGAAGAVRVGAELSQSVQSLDDHSLSTGGFV